MKLISLPCLVCALLVGITGCSRESAEMKQAYEMQQAVLRDQDLNKIEGLLQAGFNPSHPIGCGTYCALNGAIENQNPAMVHLLIKYGARPTESMVVDAAFIAREDVALDILQQFFAVGASVNSRQLYGNNPNMVWMPLGQAVWRQHPEVVKLLLAQQGIKVNYVDGDGYTPLMTAVEKGDQDIVKMLMAAGADPTISTAQHGTAMSLSNDRIDNQHSIQQLLAGNK